MKKSLYFAIGTIVGAGLGAGAIYFYMVKKQSETLATVTDQLRDYYSKNPQNGQFDPHDYDPPIAIPIPEDHEKSCDSDHKFTQDN